MTPAKASGQRDYVGEELEGMRGGSSRHQSVEDLLLAAIKKLAEDEHGARLEGFSKGLRGEPAAVPDGDAPPMPPGCESGECEHPEHQREDALPEEI